MKKKKVILSKTRKPLEKKKAIMSKTRKPLKKKQGTMSKTPKSKTTKEKSTKTILPTDQGWSLFKVNNTAAIFGESNQMKSIPKIMTGKQWVVSKGNSAKKTKDVKIFPSKDGWVQSLNNGKDSKKALLKKKYAKKFEPAKVVIVVGTNKLSKGKAKTKVRKQSDLNKKLLKENNKEDENSSLLEDEDEEIKRNLKKGNAIDVTQKKNKGSTKVKSLTRKKEDGEFSLQEGKSKIENTMQAIRKAGLDSPKNKKRVKPPKPKKGKELDLLLDRSGVAKGGEPKVKKDRPPKPKKGKELDLLLDRSEPKVEAEKDENKTASEANKQASLHESLQSAMSGIVQVFNNKVEGHSIMAAKGSLNKDAKQNVNGKKQRNTSNKQMNLPGVMWTPWSQWGSCSVSCGRGWKTRRRFCLTVTKKCEGRAIEMKFCHMKPCPGKYKVYQGERSKCVQLFSTENRKDIMQK